MINQVWCACGKKSVQKLQFLEKGKGPPFLEYQITKGRGRDSEDGLQSSRKGRGEGTLSIFGRYAEKRGGGLG